MMRVHMDWYKASVPDGGDPVHDVKIESWRLYCGSVVKALHVPTTNDRSLITCGLCHRKLRSITRMARDAHADALRATGCVPFHFNQ